MAEIVDDAPDYLQAALNYLAEPKPADPLHRISWARYIVEQAKRDVSKPRFFRSRAH